MTARQQLERAAYRAGYGPEALQAIAVALLPRYQPGRRLDDVAVAQITSAVELLAQAGLGEQQLVALLFADRRGGGPHWRARFWTAQLRVACRRFNHPELYGLSPCETDPRRLAAHGTPVARAATALTRPATQIPAA